jgi:hypothetical protein
MRISPKASLIVLLIAFPSIAWAEFSIDLAHVGANSPKEAVLFPFDNYSIPLRKGLQMDLLTSEHTRASYNPVLVRGKKGAPDSFRIGYYGTVLELNGRFHMWYIGDGEENNDQEFSSTPYGHILYATSDDGLHWQKPSLGLVEYNGSKDNNLVQTNTDNVYRSCTVLYDPEDPNPDRLYKLYFEGNPTNRGNILFSRDGLTWHPSPANPATTGLFEQSGLIKRDGMYFVAGQTGIRSGGFGHRVMVEFMSPDFDHWTDAMIASFRRDPIPPHNVYWEHNMGPQVHLGAGFWDRGNVLIGLYGQWNGDPTDNDRRFLKLNLGMIIGHDGMHFSEPIPDFKMINSDEENWTLDSMGASPRITQGQGFLNHGERTMTYYGHWGKDGNKEIRVAVWQRDRLGKYWVNRRPIEGQYPASRPAIDEPDPSQKLPYFMSCPITLPEGGGQVFLNCGNLSNTSELRVAVVDRDFKPLAGYSLNECQPVQTDGYRVPVRWKGQDRIQAKGPIRLRVQWGGIRFEDPIVYAAYVAP